MPVSKFSEKRFPYNGKTYQLGELADLFSIKYDTLYSRYRRNGSIGATIAKPGTKWHSKAFKAKRDKPKVKRKSVSDRISAEWSMEKQQTGDR